MFSRTQPARLCLAAVVLAVAVAVVVVIPVTGWVVSCSTIPIYDLAGLATYDEGI